MQNKKDHKNQFIDQLISELKQTDAEQIAHICKEGDKYQITVVSTAAIADRENETFTIEAIDYDIAQAKEHGDYPEFRVFHSPHLGIGLVTKMRRVGIFAIDEGESYTDDFSLAVCKELSTNNDGKWRASRGFKAIEVEMSCPRCNNALLIHKEHMLVGFRCPSCAKMHLSYKGMPNVQYKKARTFDVTVTDVPAVPMTSASAYNLIIKESDMNKTVLKSRLLKAGISEEIIDARLATVTDEQLKEYDDVPTAVLKEVFTGNDASEENGEQPLTLEQVTNAVVDRMKELLEDAEFELDGDTPIELEIPELKESSEVVAQIQELKEMVLDLVNIVDDLAQDEETRLKELNTRNARQNLRIYKGGMKKAKKKVDYTDEDDEDDEDEEEVTKEMQRQLGMQPKNKPTGITDGQGNSYASMTEMLLSK